MWQRIFSIIRKELIQITRDKRTLAIIMIMPIIQMALFGYVLSTDIKHISTVVWDASNTAESRDLIQSFRQTDSFSINYYARDYSEITQRIESGQAKAALVIPADYAEHLHRRETATVQLFADGSEPTAGLQALSSASAIVQAKGASLISPAQASAAVVPLSLQPRIWYNPALQSSIFYLPGLVGFIMGALLVNLTAFSIVRERENGTIEQLNVSPLRRGELIVGKLIPYIFIAYAQVILILTTAVVVFGMPIRGSLLLLLALTSLFLMFSLGIGLFISTISRTQFQAVQAAQLVMLPSFMLSGFVFPVESMPKVAQWVSAVLPLTYYLRMVRGIIVKGIGMEYLWTDTLILAAMGILTLVFAATRVRKTLA